MAFVLCFGRTEARLADRSRIVKSRVATGRYDRHRDNGRAIEGPAYRHTKRSDAEDDVKLRGSPKVSSNRIEEDKRSNYIRSSSSGQDAGGTGLGDVNMNAKPFITSSHGRERPRSVSWDS